MTGCRNIGWATSDNVQAYQSEAVIVGGLRVDEEREGVVAIVTRSCCF